MLKEQLWLLQATLYGRKAEKLLSVADERQLLLNFGNEPVAEIPEQALEKSPELKTTA